MIYLNYVNGIKFKSGDLVWRKPYNRFQELVEHVQYNMNLGLFYTDTSKVFDIEKWMSIHQYSKNPNDWSEDQKILLVLTWA